jgi:membrane associated rhomboid family serine protease
MIYRLGTFRERDASEVYPQEENLHKVRFVYIMLAANILAFIFTMNRANWQFESLAVNPVIGPSVDVLLELGAKDTDLIVNGGEWWRLFTAMFLHGGIIHLFLNMSMLLRIGKDIELYFGFFRVAVIYLLAGISGNILSSIFVPQLVGVGASGALYGLIGALYGDFFQNHKTIQNKWCYLFSLVLSTVVGLGIGLLPLIDNFGHVGGFIYGLMAGSVFLTLNKTTARGETSTPWYSDVLTVLCTIGIAVWFIVGFVVLFEEVDAEGFCPWCTFVNCVPSPWWSCEAQCVQTFPNGTEVIVNCDDVM